MQGGSSNPLQAGSDPVLGGSYPVRRGSKILHRGFTPVIGASNLCDGVLSHAPCTRVTTKKHRSQGTQMIATQHNGGPYFHFLFFSCP